MESENEGAGGEVEWDELYKQKIENFPTVERYLDRLLGREGEVRFPGEETALRFPKGLVTLHNLPYAETEADPRMKDILSATVGAAEAANNGTWTDAHVRILASSMYETVHMGVFLPENEEMYWGVNLSKAWDGSALAKLTHQEQSDLKTHLLLWRAWAVILVHDEHRATMIDVTLLHLRNTGVPVNIPEDRTVDTRSRHVVVMMLSLMLQYGLVGNVMHDTLLRLPKKKKLKANGLTPKEITNLTEFVTIHTMKKLTARK